MRSESLSMFQTSTKCLSFKTPTAYQPSYNPQLYDRYKHKQMQTVNVTNSSPAIQDDPDSDDDDLMTSFVVSHCTSPHIPISTQSQTDAQHPSPTYSIIHSANQSIDSSQNHSIIPLHSQTSNVSQSHLSFLQQTITNLSAEIKHLNSVNCNLLQTIQSLQSSINAINFPIISRQLQSLNPSLMNPSSKNVTFQSNSITSYLANSPTSSTKSTSCTATTITNKKKTRFNVKSKTVQSFIANEGKMHFEVIKKQTNILMDMMDVDADQYLFRCKVCNKRAPTNLKKTYKYIHGVLLNLHDLTSITYLKQAKRGIENHVNDVLLHIQSVRSEKQNQILVSPLYIKVETVYFMLQRSSPLVVFEELMVYLQQLIDHFSCDQHEFCLDIGNKQQSKAEADRIVKMFSNVMHNQTIYVLQHSLYSSSKVNVVLFSMSIDGWSRGIVAMYKCIHTFMYFFFFLTFI